MYFTIKLRERRCDAAASAQTAQEFRDVLRIRVDLDDSREEAPGTLIGLAGDRILISGS